MGKLYSIKDGKLSLKFHRGQTQAWDSDKEFVFVLAGTQGGKTQFAPWWLWREMNRTAESHLDGPKDNNYLAISASNNLFKLAFLPAMREIYENVLKIGRYWVSDKVMEICCLDKKDERYRQFLATRSSDLMWARIVLCSAESKGGLESSTAKAVMMDECGQDSFTLQSWEAVQRRISTTGGRVLGITTLYNIGWLYENIYIPWQDGDPSIDVIQFPSYYNPSFPMEKYLRAKKSMPPWRFAMFYDGKFERPSGVIYRAFEESTMLIDRFDIPEHWEHVIGVDFGGANTATIWLAQDPKDERWYAYRETHDGHVPTEFVCRKLGELREGIEDIVAIGGAPGESQQRLDWARNDFPVGEPLVSDVEAGIERVISLMKGDRLRVFRDMEGLRKQLRMYRRKLDDAGNVTNVILKKGNYHFNDALRYAATYIEEPMGAEVKTYSEFIAQMKKEGRYSTA